MTAFVAGSVVWKMKAAGMLVTVDMSQPVAVGAVAKTTSSNTNPSKQSSEQQEHKGA